MADQPRAGLTAVVRERVTRWRELRAAAAPSDEVTRPDPPQVTSTEGAAYAFKEAAIFSGRFLVIMAALYVLYVLLNAISLVTITLTVSVMISAVLRPIVNTLVDWHVPRWIAASVTFIGGVAALGLSAWFVISQVANSTDAIAAQLQNANDEIFRWLVEGPLKVSQSQIAQVSDELGNWLTRYQAQLLSGAYTTATSVLGVLSGILLVFFTLLFLLLDDGSIWRWFLGLFPASAQDRVSGGGDVAWKTLVAYMRSTVVLALINALTMVVIMMIGRIELYVPLGVLLFLGSLIPMVGMLVAGLVLVLVALVMNGPVTALVMGIALFLTVQLEGNLLNPYILGKAVNIHPLAILATVTAGTLAGGIFGAFVAVPLVAIVNNVAVALRARAFTPEPPLLEAEEFPDLPAPTTEPA